MTPSNADDWPDTPYPGTNPPQIRQDPTTKCTDPADKDAVIRDLRTKLNDKQGIIDSIRGDAEAAHRKIEGAMKHRKSERLREALCAIENIIESMGTRAGATPTHSYAEGRTVRNCVDMCQIVLSEDAGRPCPITGKTVAWELIESIGVKP